MRRGALFRGHIALWLALNPARLSLPNLYLSLNLLQLSLQVLERLLLGFEFFELAVVIL